MYESLPTLVLAMNHPAVLVGTRVSVMVQKGVEPVVRPTIPTWVRSLANSLQFVVDGALTSQTPTHITSSEQIERLAALIEDRHRTGAVVVVHTSSVRSPHAHAASKLAQRVAGAAHVFTVGDLGATRLENRLGAAGAVPARGARLYTRQFDADVASVGCPVLVAPEWPSTPGVTALADACAATTVAVQDVSVDLPAFAQVRQLIARERRRQDRERFISDTSRDAGEIEALRAALARAEEDAEAAEQLAQEQQQRAEDTAMQLRKQNAKLMMGSSRDTCKNGTHLLKRNALSEAWLEI